MRSIGDLILPFDSVILIYVFSVSYKFLLCIGCFEKSEPTADNLRVKVRRCYTYRFSIVSWLFNSFNLFHSS